MPIIFHSLLYICDCYQYKMTAFKSMQNLMLTYTLPDTTSVYLILLRGSQPEFVKKHRNMLLRCWGNVRVDVSSSNTGCGFEG